jgi:hypothetical protein
VPNDPSGQPNRPTRLTVVNGPCAGHRVTVQADEQGRPPRDVFIQVDEQGRAVVVSLDVKALEAPGWTPYASQRVGTRWELVWVGPTGRTAASN